MRYAITMEHNLVFQHFGKCPQFLLVDLEDGAIQSKQILKSGTAGHGALADLLAQAEVQVLVCGGIGGGARDALAAKHIDVIAGQNGNIDELLEKLKMQTLADDPSGSCHHHEAGDHDCGSTGCK